ncbi:hypothetical protein GH714_014866 [Hevea brasiliensis]|uniref:Uncharacterized protein n=1 Tax=Hevea brasiliensis TaxID=3981 RepID=A0A6A6LJB1_HEVBR|nr:hypothetical protein GH714_014866 [Hevea brasiliensis]
MGRAPCDKANVKKGPWSPEEDSKLKEYIEKFGTGGNWIALPQKAGLKRCGKSCRLRWLNYLRPNIKHGEFSDEEDRIICTLFASIGSSQISYGGGREIKQEDMGFQGYISNGYEKNHKFMLSYGNNSVNGSGNLNQWAEKATGYFGETPPLEYDLEDVKQLISSSSNNSCNNNFLIDENKTQERFMYYY